MLDFLKSAFGGGNADLEELKKRYERLSEMYQLSLDEYEELSSKYYALKRSLQDEDAHAAGDAAAPRCERKARETARYFRMEDSSRFPEFRRFLRLSGFWTEDAEPDIRAGHFENGEPNAWFIGENFHRIEIPYGCVFLVFERNPKTGWLVMTDEKFDRDWVPVP